MLIKLSCEATADDSDQNIFRYDPNEFSMSQADTLLVYTRAVHAVRLMALHEWVPPLTVSSRQYNEGVEGSTGG